MKKLSSITLEKKSKKMPVLALAVVLVASPAFAMRITNLDKVPQTVALTSDGQTERHTIEPGDTEYFTGNSTGLLSLVAAKPKVAGDDSTVHSDGLLAGIVGAERNTNIPVDPMNDYTIWPGGKLSIQSSKRAASGHQF